MAVGGHKKECKRLKAEKEAADAAAAAELARLTLRGAGSSSTGAGASGSGSRRGSGSVRVPLGGDRGIGADEGRGVGGRGKNNKGATGGGIQIGELD